MRGELLLSHASIKLHVPKIQQMSLVEEQHLASDEASRSFLLWDQILAKAEMLNPGGSVKDRVALEMVREAMADGHLKPGGLITEGTAGV